MATHPASTRILGPFALFTAFMLSAPCALPAAAAGEAPWRVPGIEGLPATFGALSLPAGALPPEASAETRIAGSPRDRSWPQTTLRTVVPPVFYDLDRDGTLEVIAADDRYIYVYDHTGALRPGWPIDIGGAMMQAAVGDLDGDGQPEILIGSSLPVPRLWAFTAGGVVKDGWPVPLPYTSLANTTCPVLADLDGDGHMEAGIASENGVSFFSADGTPVSGWPYLWPVSINNPQWSGPAVGDIDGDGSLEVAVGNADYPDWGVHVIRADGTAMPGWPKVIKPVWSSPALADLDHDGKLEVIAQEGDPGSQGYRLWVWRFDGTVFPGWPRNIAVEGQSSRCSPAVADIDNDGALEIITATGDGLLHVLRADGTDYPGYPRSTGGVQPISSPAVIDVDGDGIEEIFLTYWLSNTQYVSGWHLDGTTLTGFPVVLFSGTDINAHSSVHVADAEGDGHLDLAVSATSSSSGRIWVIPVGGSVYNPDTRADWPKMRRDSANLGRYPALDPAGVRPQAAVPADWRVFPNPVPPGGRLTFSSGKEAPPACLRMFDAAGREIWRGGFSGQAGFGVRDLFGSRGASPGVYYFRADGHRSGRAVPVVIL